tara:strand:+ start:1334 stop:1915 length:582 start_codon:yes stop_codon:yes gene_type:complete
LKTLVENTEKLNFDKNLNIHFTNIKKSFVYLNKSDNNILASNTDLDSKNNKNNIEKYANIKLHENSRVFLKSSLEIEINIIKDLIKNLDKNLFSKDKILLESRLTIIPVEKKNKNAIHTGWYKFILNENNLLFTGSLFYFYKNISELLNYFIHNVQMNLLFSKFDNHYYFRSEYPFSMYSKTFFDDKNIFFVK